MFFRNLKFGLRLLGRAPGATAIAMLALGLGVGANTAIFSIANGILLHPLPYQHLNRLLDISEIAPHDPPTSTNSVSPYNYLTWKQQARTLEAVTAYHYLDYNLSGQGAPTMVLGGAVPANFFAVLPSKPLLGRTFLPVEEQVGHEHVVVLSQALWQHQYASDPRIVGRSIQVNQQPYTVIGVLGESAVMPAGAELWTPLALSPTDRDTRDNHYLRVVGELAPGATLDQAAAELHAIVGRTDARYPATNADWGVHVQTLADRTIGNETASYVFLLMGAVGFLLLIACANVANLQFARTLGRNHELAIRTALGAGRGRIVGQLLTESLLLGLGGAVVGAAFAFVSIRMILAYMPAEVARFIGGWQYVRLDPTALAYTLGIAIAAGVLAGIAPAWHAARPDLNATLKEGGRGAIGHARRRLRSALVVVQVALALVLLVGAALMVEGFNANLSGE
ncbi:MAG: ABC transporter permease, partial [Terriglobales bacterium]